MITDIIEKDMSEAGTIYDMTIDDLDSYHLSDFFAATRPTAFQLWFGGWEV